MTDNGQPTTDNMKVLHLAAGNRWTGAAAPAFAEVEALREAGIDAHFAYVGGYKLQQKIGRHDFAHPLIEKAQNPLTFGRSVEALRRMVARHGFDFLHAHLTYDHWLARFVARDTGVRLARTFHARRTLRTDPFTKSLVRRSAPLFVVNDTFRDSPLLRDREVFFTPPPLDQRQFTPDGANLRGQYGISRDSRVFVAIGKLAPGRGFEEVLRSFAVILADDPRAHLMIIGHGPHQPALERLSASLGVARSVTWAGYHEDDLAEHYRSADVLLFTAKGSDEGHRALLEAMACGVLPVTYPIEGVNALLGELSRRLIADAPTPQSLGQRASGVSADPSIRDLVVEHARLFHYRHAAQRLFAAYQSAL